jgi:hypothetical protein
MADNLARTAPRTMKIKGENESEDENDLSVRGFVRVSSVFRPCES